MTGRRRPALAGWLPALLLAVAAPGAAGAEDAAGCGMSAAEIFAARAPQVVDVVSLSINPFRVIDRVTTGAGTGIVLGEGYVATNYHVVADASEVVIFVGDDAFPTEIAAIDPSLDIALLVTWFPPADSEIPFAPDGSYRVGDRAFVIGNPLGLGKSISAGIVSGLSRVLPRTTTNWLSPFIQTDAAISPGNSGGPLLDDCGRVIGMVTGAIFDIPVENVAFAIPVDVLRPALEELIDSGRIARPWHGLYGQMVSPPVLSLLGVPGPEIEAATGFLVETVEPGSAADRLGLRGGTWPVRWGMNEILLGGDIILEVNGTRLLTLDTALEAVRALRIGEETSIVYIRDGERREGTVVLEERPLLEAEKEIYRQRR